MPEHDRKIWDHRYDTEELIHGSRPSEFLVSNWEYLPNRGLALDLAAGEGRNSIFLAELGLEVVALDIAERGLRKCRDRAGKDSAGILPAVVDLEQYQLPKETFELVINFNYLNRGLTGQIMDSLKPGGVLVYETLTRDHLRWKPDFNPTFLLEQGELAAMFSNLTLLKYRECDLVEFERRRSVASLIGRRD